MNHLVPDFGLENDYVIIPSSTPGGGDGGAGGGGGDGVSRPRKSTMADDDIMELLWQNGQVVMQTQNQRTAKKSSLSTSSFKPPIVDIVQHTENEFRPHSNAAQATMEEEVVSANHLFMQEDEMASWLHYPLDDDNSFERDFCTDFLYPPPPPSPTVTAVTAAAAAAATATANASVVDARSTAAVAEQKLAQMSLSRTAARPPVPVVPPADVVDRSRFLNFRHFSRMKPARIKSGPSESHQCEQTVVDSSTTPAAAMERDSRLLSQLVRSTGGEISNITAASAYGMSGAAVASTSSAGRDMNTCDGTTTVTSSSPGGSGSVASFSASVEPTRRKQPQAVDRKRKARQAVAADEAECYNSEDVEFEPADAKKQARGSTSTKRSRAAEVHNLSERRRRDRINEKMKTLQELIPRCNKVDKASMLDEAIEYLKSLQLQLQYAQMMSMGCSMVPMMFPGGQHYMPPMGMGMGMGLGVGMDMSMSRPMVPYPSAFAGAPMPNPSTSSHLGPRFPMPAYHMQQLPPVPPPDHLSRLQTTRQSDPTLNPLASSQSPSQPRLPNLPDPYQRFLGLHQMPLPILQQNQQAMAAQPSTTKPSATTGAENSGHHQQSG